LTGDNSVFAINGGDPYLLFGIGGVDDAEDADVIVHEYGHALSYYAAPNTNSGRERRGLDEGIADYFAAIYSQDLGAPSWHLLLNWDGHNEFWPGRIAISSMKYPPASTSIYAYGEIWVSTLMQLRNAIGPETVDKIVLEEMYSNFSGMSLVDAAQLMLDADSALYDGVHTEVMLSYFCQRGIEIPNLSDCIVVSTPQEEPAPGMKWDLSPNPGSGPFYFSWRAPGFPRITTLNIFNSLGQAVFTVSLTGPGPHRLDLSLPPGIYTARVSGKAGRYESRRIMILP
jgi:hypothetical protein